MGYRDDDDCPHGTLPAKLGILEGVQACLDAMIGLAELSNSSPILNKLERLEKEYWKLYDQYKDEE